MEKMRNLTFPLGNTIIENHPNYRGATVCENYIIYLCCAKYGKISPACSRIADSFQELEPFSYDDVLQAAKDLMQKAKDDEIDKEEIRNYLAAKSVPAKESNRNALRF